MHECFICASVAGNSHFIDKCDKGVMLLRGNAGFSFLISTLMHDTHCF